MQSTSLLSFLGTTKVDDGDINTVALKIGLSNDQLTTLFCELGLSDTDVENARRTADTRDYKLQGKKVLGVWKSQNGGNATREKIIHALKEARYNEAVETLQNKFKW